MIVLPNAYFDAVVGDLRPMLAGEKSGASGRDLSVRCQVSPLHEPSVSGRGKVIVRQVTFKRQLVLGLSSNFGGVHAGNYKSRRRFVHPVHNRM